MKESSRNIASHRKTTYDIDANRSNPWDPYRPYNPNAPTSVTVTEYDPSLEAQRCRLAVEREQTKLQIELYLSITYASMVGGGILTALGVIIIAVPKTKPRKKNLNTLSEVEDMDTWMEELGK